MINYHELQHLCGDLTKMVLLAQQLDEEIDSNEESAAPAEGLIKAAEDAKDFLNAQIADTAYKILWMVEKHD